MQYTQFFEYKERYYWRVYKHISGKIEVIPMSAWDEFDYDQNRFITLKLFKTKEEAQYFLNDFWHTYERICLT